MSKRPTKIRPYNTHVVRDEKGIVSVQLYDTVIAKRLEDGRYLLDTGGFNTRTTMDRLEGLFCELDIRYFMAPCIRKARPTICRFHGDKVDYVEFNSDNRIIINPITLHIDTLHESISI